METSNAPYLGQRVHVAQLLGPGEAKAAGHTLIQRPTFDGYLLQVPIPDAYVRQFERQGAALALRFPVFPLPCGVMLAVPTLQAGTFQMRVAVPLVDAKACDWMHWCIDAARVAWLLEVGEKGQAVRVESCQAFPNPERLRALVRRSRTSVTTMDVLPDIVAAMVQLVDNEGVPSCHSGMHVTDVHVSVVSDFVVYAGVPDAFAKLAGAPPTAH